MRSPFEHDGSTMVPLTRLVVLAVAALVLLPATAAARRVRGPCQWLRGVCYPTLDHVLTVDEAARLRDPATLPDEPAEVVVKDMRSGEIRLEHGPLLVPDSTRRPLDGGESLRDPSLAPTTREMTRVDRPWTQEFYRSFAKLFMEFPNGTYGACSGTYIGTRTVLTAGHCVYDGEGGGFATKVEIFPAMEGYYVTPYGSTESSQIRSNSWWTQSEDYRGDIAVVSTQDALGQLTGAAPVEAGTSSFSGVINVAGYPGDYEEGLALYRNWGNLNSVESYLICHAADTYHGMSGGPVWRYNDTDGRRLVAVNSYFTETQPGQFYESCAARYSDFTADQRTESEGEAAQTPADYWTCDMSWFGDEQGCDCDCGSWDPDCNDFEQEVLRCPPNSVCDRPGVCRCVRQCTGEQCGPDGCGGVCGTCSEHQSCNESGMCVCEPDCSGRTCGSDFCGGSCGTCRDGQSCLGGECRGGDDSGDGGGGDVGRVGCGRGCTTTGAVTDAPWAVLIGLLLVFRRRERGPSGG